MVGCDTKKLLTESVKNVLDTNGIKNDAIDRSD